MRTTMLVLLCSFAGCAGPVGGQGGPRADHDGPDAGVDGAAAGGPCVELEEMTINLSIAGDSGFQNLPSSCWKLNGKLTIAGPAVTSLAKLGDLRSVTDLELNNTALASIDTKSALEVTGTLWVRYNDKLTDIAKLTPAATVDTITIEHNALLTSLGGVTKAAVVAGQTTIVDNPKLTAVNLGSAQRLEGGLVVSDNTEAKTLDLTRLQSVGSLTISNNGELTSITAGSLLSNIHGTLTVDNNDKLTSLGSIGSASTIDANVIVSGNLTLADLGQLSHAARVFGVVQVTTNAALDVTRAHDIGCCVATGGFTANANKNNQCTGDHWCMATQNCFR